MNVSILCTEDFSDVEVFVTYGVPAVQDPNNTNTSIYCFVSHQCLE